MLAEQMSLAEVKNRLSEVVDGVEREHRRVVITKHGRPAAVVLSADDLDSIEKTMDVIASEGLLGDIREALAQLRDAPPAALSKAEAQRHPSRPPHGQARSDVTYSCSRPNR